MDIEALEVFKQYHDFARENMAEMWGENPSERDQGYLDALGDVSIGLQDIIDYERNKPV